MMELDLLNIELRKKIGDKKNIVVYSFGSINSKENCNDIDLLIVYNRLNQLSEAIEIKNYLKKFILNTFGIPGDILLFSKNESQKNPFLQEEKCIQIYPNK